MRTLIVEDDKTSLRLLESILADYGSCDRASDGLQALFSFREAWREGRPYDLILLDIKIPELDGQKVLEAIRDVEDKNDFGSRSRVKIIMTTGLNDRDHIQSAFSEGCEAYLVKPIQRDQLLQRIHDLGLFS